MLVVDGLDLQEPHGTLFVTTSPEVLRQASICANCIVANRNAMQPADKMQLLRRHCTQGACAIGVRQLKSLTACALRVSACHGAAVVLSLQQACV